MTVLLADVETRYGFTALDYLDRQAAVPTVTTAGCQGDVSILRVTTDPATTPIPARGYVVATGQGGHDHTLVPGAFFDAAVPVDGSLTIGTLTVPGGAEGYMTHPEHGALLIAPGTYRIGAQREFAGEWRRVAD